MCPSKVLLIVFKILNGVCGGGLLVLGIYLSEAITAQSTAPTLTITATKIEAFVQIVSLVVKVLGYTNCVRESNNTRKGLSVIKGFLFAASLVVASYTGSTSSTFLGGIHLPTVILIVPGVIAVALSALGWFALLHKCDILLACSGILMLILLLLEVAGLVVIHVRNAVWPSLKHTMTLYAFTSGVKQVWDFAQMNFGCCGLDKSSDWITVGISSGLNSCGTALETRGCFTVFQDFLRHNDRIIGSVAGLVLLIQMCAGVASIVVSRSSAKGSHRGCII